MALNMSKDSDSDRHTDSPTHQSDTDGEKDEMPINLHNGSGDSSGRRSAAGSGSDGEHSPASPSSDTGLIYIFFLLHPTMSSITFTKFIK
jgi:hypothetical protein